MTINRFKNIVIRYSLLIILMIAAILRLWNLAGNPPHLTPDEAALGYNAYSILETGKDEHGKFMPIVFESFGDWKPGLYIYATVPFVATLGLTEFAVRLPSVLAGIVAVWFLYKIVLNFAKQNSKLLTTNYQLLAKIAAFMLAISPWHIQFSRGAWEVNLALTLTLAGIYLFLKSFQKPKALIFSAIFFAFTFWAYQGAKLSTTIVIFILCITFWTDIRKYYIPLTRTVLVSIVVGVLIILPIIFSLISGKSGRLEVFSMFSYPRPIEYVQNILDQGNEIRPSVIYYLFHSETLSFSRAVALKWFNHFSGRFLFFEGDWQNPRHTVPNHGVLLLSDLLFLMFGVIFILKSKIHNLKSFILLWLILSPLPAVLSRDSVHAVRALNMIIPLTLVSACGVLNLINHINKLENLLKKVSVSFVSFLFLGSFIYFSDAYFIHQPIHNANYWFYGYRQAVEETTKLQKDHKNVLFIQSYAQPYIYFLFYQKYPPQKYQQKSQIVYDSAIDVGLVQNLDNITFRGFAWPAPAVKGDIVVGTPIDIPDYFADQGFRLIKEIKQLNGNPAFRIVEKTI